MTIPVATMTPWPAGHIAGALGLLRPCIFGGHSVLLDRWIAQAAAELIREHNVVANFRSTCNARGFGWMQPPP